MQARRITRFDVRKLSSAQPQAVSAPPKKEKSFGWFKKRSKTMKTTSTNDSATTSPIDNTSLSPPLPVPGTQRVRPSSAIMMNTRPLSAYQPTTSTAAPSSATTTGVLAPSMPDLGSATTMPRLPSASMNYNHSNNNNIKNNGVVVNAGVGEGGAVEGVGYAASNVVFVGGTTANGGAVASDAVTAVTSGVGTASGVPGTTTPSTNTTPGTTLGRPATTTSAALSPNGKPMRLRYHSGPIDQKALTSKPPQILIAEIRRVFEEMGMSVRASSSDAFRVKVTRPKLTAEQMQMQYQSRWIMQQQQVQFHQQVQMQLQQQQAQQQQQQQLQGGSRASSRNPSPVPPLNRQASKVESQDSLMSVASLATSVAGGAMTTGAGHVPVPALATVAERDGDESGREDAVGADEPVTPTSPASTSRPGSIKPTIHRNKSRSNGHVSVRSLGVSGAEQKRQSVVSVPGMPSAASSTNGVQVVVAANAVAVGSEGAPAAAVKKGHASSNSIGQASVGSVGSNTPAGVASTPPPAPAPAAPSSSAPRIGRVITSFPMSFIRRLKYMAEAGRSYNKGFDGKQPPVVPAPAANVVAQPQQTGAGGSNTISPVTSSASSVVSRGPAPSHGEDVTVTALPSPTIAASMVLPTYPILDAATVAPAVEGPNETNPALIGPPNLLNPNLNNNDANNYRYFDTGGEIKFYVEIQKIKNLRGLYVVEFKRRKGDIWAFKGLYQEVIPRLPLKTPGELF
ncbi:hypothetical protein HK102_004179 [Quaeritorhiza haematococci]|nr:hypothetical protein HK102_004179 [Quaeritorhiza haematococci]